MDRYNISAEIEIDRIADRKRIEHECSNQEEDPHEYVGDCVFCKHAIYADDNDYIINDEEQLGICVLCMDKCHWR